MPIIDRNSYSDAQACISALLENHGASDQIASFLSGKVELANKLDRQNWNLNLALDGKFLRFNVGQGFCIEIDKNGVLILCLKENVPINVQKEQDDLYFIGYEKRSIIESHDFDNTPQCLEKIQDSIGIKITENFVDWSALLDKGNARFIERAITKTKILPRMIGAHSVGAIEYLSDFVECDLPNPSFVLEAIAKNEERILLESKTMSDNKLADLARRHCTRQMETTISVFIRNPLVIEQARRRAKGKCQDCRQPAPFLNKLTGEPFLEVHHVIPLSRGGSDTIENVLALCPNCHRKRHHG